MQTILCFDHVDCSPIGEPLASSRKHICSLSLLEIPLVYLKVLYLLSTFIELNIIWWNIFHYLSFYLELVCAARAEPARLGSFIGSSQNLKFEPKLFQFKKNRLKTSILVDYDRNRENIFKYVASIMVTLVIQ